MKVARPAATAAVRRPRRAPDLAVSHSTVAAATKEAITAYIGIGANLGDPLEQVTSAIAALATLPMTRLLGTSSAYRSAPMGGMRDDSQPDYVNAVARIQTLLDARTLLDRLLDIENRHGRFRSFPNAPRTLDLDLLLFGEQQIDQPGLCVPHPRMHLRRFVLDPLIEIAPDLYIPGQGAVARLATATRDQAVERIARQGPGV
jgi:2-amino-4-hydroxy-6-hydroxymethyldihydropteridine diphosphokinase